MTMSIEKTAYQQVDEVARQTRANLKFNPSYGIDEHPTEGNCYEFSMRTHDSLQKLGYISYIGYSYDHAFNIGAKDGALYVASSDVPGLSVIDGKDSPLDKLFPAESGSLASSIVRAEIDSSEAGHLNMAQLHTNLKVSQQQAVHKYNPWFDVMWLQAKFPAVTIMDPSFARDALTNYFGFRRGLAAKDYEQIKDSLGHLSVKTPQNETRPRYNSELGDFKRAVRQMSRRSEIQQVSAQDLSDLIEMYIEILPPVNAGSNTVFGDCYRSIGTIYGCQSAFDQAHKLYGIAADVSYKRRKRDNPVILGKLNKLKTVGA